MAKMSTADIIKQILSMASGAAMASYGGPIGGAAGVLAGVRIPASGTKERDYTASEYPTEFAPGENHEYDVQWVALPKGKADNNSMGKANKGLVEDAGIMQTKEAHNAALTKYLRQGMNPAQQYLAIQKGREEEKQLPQFWNESYSRLPFQVSSSAVNGIRITPGGAVEVRWKSSPKWYVFQQFPDTYQASKAAQELLKADSIGRAVMPFQRKGKPLKFKDDASDHSWWNKKYYNSAFA